MIYAIVGKQPCSAGVVFFFLSILIFSIFVSSTFIMSQGKNKTLKQTPSWKVKYTKNIFLFILQLLGLTWDPSLQGGVVYVVIGCLELYGKLPYNCFRKKEYLVQNYLSNFLCFLYQKQHNRFCRVSMAFTPHGQDELRITQIGTQLCSQVWFINAW